MPESELKRCPSCGHGRPEIDNLIFKAVYCPQCFMRGPIAKSKRGAIAAWNALPRKTDKERNPK